MLLTRYAPLRRSPAMYCYIPLPLDLHVLSLPLAFILSQDQTLHCICFISQLVLTITNSKRINAYSFLGTLLVLSSSIFQSTFVFPSQAPLSFSPFLLDWERKDMVSFFILQIFFAFFLKNFSSFF